jgi:hypothetical protein
MLFCLNKKEIHFSIVADPPLEGEASNAVARIVIIFIGALLITLK